MLDDEEGIAGAFVVRKPALAVVGDKLLECLERYDRNQKAQFITFFSRCLDNALINFVNTAENRKMTLSLDYQWDSPPEGDSLSNLFNLQDKIGEEDSRFEDLDTMLYFQSISQNLDENERKVCAVILANPHNLTYREIAKEIGLTLAAIPNILKRLRKKFNKSGLITDKLVSSL